MTIASLGVVAAIGVIAVVAVAFVLLLRTSWGRRRLNSVTDKVDRRL